MQEIWTLGEPLCEIMRTQPDIGLESPDIFMGPYPSGAPAIFIDSAAKLGHPCGLIGTIGDDAFGRCIKKRLHDDGVNITHLAVNDELSTAVAFVSYFSDGSRTFLYHIGNAAAGQIEYPRQMPENVGLFHVMGCAMMPSPTMAEAVIRAAIHYADQGKLISFDPNIRVESLRGQDLSKLIDPIMKRCSIFMPGLEELLVISGKTSVEDAVSSLFQNPLLKVVVLKNGSNGCQIITRDEQFSLPSCNITALDSTGAGDSFDAGFLTSYLQGKPLLDCAKIASATAALNCSAFGPMEGNITQEKVRKMVEENYGA